MPTGRSKNTRGFKPTYDDILEYLPYMEVELGGLIRFTTVLGRREGCMPLLKTVIQLYQVHDGKAWIMAERTFVWPNNEGRDFNATLMLELHRAYHRWGDLGHGVSPQQDQ